MKKVWITVAGLAFAQSALALSLGEIVTTSGFGEPLRARIAIPSYQKGELNDLNIGLADKAFFQDKGIEWVGSHDNMKFTLVTEDSNNPYIAVETTRPMYDLNLGFLIKVGGSSSTIMRRYDILVAAPMAKKAVMDASVNGRENESNNSSVVSQQLAPLPQITVVSSSREVVSSQPSTIKYGPIKKGDVLSIVAQKMRGDRKASLPQMVMAIYKQNPHAFLNNNINELIAGSTLVIDDFARVKEVSKKAAIQFVDAQSRAWDERRTGAVADSAVASAAPASTNVESRFTIEEVDSKEPMSNNGAEAQHVAGVESDVSVRGSGGGVVSLQRDLLMAEEEVQALRVENEDLLSRISAAESQLQESVQNIVASAVQGVSILSKDTTLYTDDIAMANNDISGIETQGLGLWGVLGMGLVMLGLAALAYMYVQHHRHESDFPAIEYPSPVASGMASMWKRWRHS